MFFRGERGELCNYSPFNLPVGECYCTMTTERLLFFSFETEKTFPTDDFCILCRLHVCIMYFYPSYAFVDAEHSYSKLTNQIDFQAFPLNANGKNIKLFISLSYGPVDKNLFFKKPY